MTCATRIAISLLAAASLNFAPAGGGGLKRLSLGTDAITGGYGLSGIVEIFSCSANQQYTVVDITSSMPGVASVESPVYVECGFPNTSDFGITTSVVTSTKTVTIRATKGSIVRERTLTVYPQPHVLSLNVQEPAYYELPTYATMHLDFPAPPGGLAVTVSSSDTYNNPPWRGVLSNPVQNKCAIENYYSTAAVIEAGQTSCSFPVGILSSVWTPPTVTLTASAGGLMAQDTFSVLTPQPNLIIRKIELTQAIQYLDDPNPLYADNALPLILNKPLAVRVYVNSEATGQAYDDVPVVLWTRTSSSDTWHAQNNQVSQPMRVLPVITNEEQRYNWSGATLNNVTFLVAPNDFAGGKLDLRAEVNAFPPFHQGPAHAVTEVNYNDNTRELTGIKFHPTEDLKVKFVRIDWHAHPFGGHKKPSWSRLDDIVPYLEMVYPVDHVRYWKASKEVNVGILEVLIGAEDFSDKWAWEVVLAKLELFESFTTDQVLGIKYYALLKESVGHNTIGGLARTTGARAAAAGHAGEHENQGGTLDDSASTAAQEIGHLFERSHAPCNNPPDQDHNWPAATNPGAIIGHTGFNVVEPQPLKGGYFTDFMSYCRPNWVSPYTYCSLYRRFVSDGSSCSAPNVPAEPPIIHLPTELPDKAGPYIALRGVIGHDKSVLLPSYATASASRISAGDGRGPYLLILMDRAGKPLLTRKFDAADSQGPGGAFLEFVPLLAGVARIELRQGARVLAKQRVSARAPSVKMLAPKSGERFTDPSKPLEVRWQASDPDNDHLRYMLLYSRDDGRRWEVLDVDFDEQFAAIDLQELPGSERARFRVVASDGFHVAEDETGTLSVASKSPEVTIVAPKDSRLKSPVVLRGMAYDAEDGSLPDEAMSWSSDRDGALGTGRSVIAALSPGQHVLTLRAQDSDKQTSEVKITVNVR